jgi:hypothetical protein
MFYFLRLILMSWKSLSQKVMHIDFRGFNGFTENDVA